MEPAIPETVQIIAFAFLLVALVLSFLRLLRGPAVNDRIVAMDLIASIIMGFILLYSVLIRRAIYFDLAIVISLISFIGTVAISTYLKQKR
jgi:multicomponent Na+:H+ antiporter subunit F